MATFATRMYQKTKAIIDKYGKTVLVRTFASSNFDPSTGSVDQTGMLEYEPKITPPSLLSEGTPQGNASSQVGDLQCFAAEKDLNFVPGLQQVMEFDNEVWQIVFINKIYAGEVLVLWEWHLRK